MDSLYLVRNGVPFDVAFSLDRAERLHWIVALGTMSGMTFDWAQQSWIDPH